VSIFDIQFFSAIGSPAFTLVFLLTSPRDKVKAVSIPLGLMLLSWLAFATIGESETTRKGLVCVEAALLMAAIAIRRGWLPIMARKA